MKNKLLIIFIVMGTIFQAICSGIIIHSGKGTFINWIVVICGIITFVLLLLILITFAIEKIKTRGDTNAI